MRPTRIDASQLELVYLYVSVSAWFALQAHPQDPGCAHHVHPVAQVRVLGVQTFCLVGWWAQCWKRQGQLPGMPLQGSAAAVHPLSLL